MKLLAAICAASMMLVGCNAKVSSNTTTTKTADHDHDGHDHDGHDHGGHEDGPMMDLGQATGGGFTATVKRSQAAVVAGKEVVIDMDIEGASKITAVRVWIGTEDAKGSMKVKGELEDAAHPEDWHAHVEAPNPIPAGSKVWIEIEGAAGKTTLSLDLKM